MRVSYVYDLRLPSRHSAAIQILSTCRAVCDLGAPVDLYVERWEGAEADALAHFGLQPHPLFRLRTLPRGRSGRLNARALRSALGPPGSGRHVLMSRGESGIELFTRLGALPRPEGERHVYEAHRLSFSHVPEGEPRAVRLRKGPSWLRSRRMRAREAATVRAADGVVCLTRGVRAALDAEFGLARPALILASGTRVGSAAPTGDDGRDIDILYAGKLERRKGVELLLDALVHLPGRTAWVVGGSDAQVARYREAAAARGVADRVVTTGYVRPTELDPLYRRARAGVCPLPAGGSRIAEEFTSPLKVLEMMAAGVPVVASDVPSMRELLSDGETALLTPPNDARGLAAGIRKLLEDRALAERLAGSARAEVERYSWPARARRLLDFLASLP